MKCKCGSDMDQIYDPLEKVTRGWYCVKCRHFEKAIGREKKLPIGGDDGTEVHGTPEGSD